MHISTDSSKFDLPLIHAFLSQDSAWAKNIPFETLQRAIANSLCFGGFVAGRQIAFARVITDRATFAYLADVFVVASERGQGHSKTLVSAILAHPELQNLRRFMLSSSDARGLYQQFGFTAPARPEILMEIHKPLVYQNE